MKTTTIDLLRHGKPEGGEIFRGHLNVALSETGWQQMQSAVESETPWQRIVTSPMDRCAAFARWLAEKESLALAEYPGLREISFGEWDGKPFAEVQAQYGELFDKFWQNPLEHTPPQGEPMAVFCQRVADALWQLVKAHQGEHLLLVTHGGVIRAMLAEILATDGISLTRYDVPYASFSRLRVYHDERGDWPQLVFFNRNG